MATSLTSRSALQNKQQNVPTAAAVQPRPPYLPFNMPPPHLLSIIACISAANGGDDRQIDALLPAEVSDRRRWWVL